MLSIWVGVRSPHRVLTLVGVALRSRNTFSLIELITLLQVQLHFFSIKNSFSSFVSDRKAVPTIVVVRRDDVSAMEIEVVRIELRLVGADSPVVAIDARGPQRASSHIHVPATS